MTNTYHPQKGPYLRDLQPGDRFIGFYVVRNKQLEPFRDPSRGVFLTLILSDRSGQLLARVWDNAESTADKLEKKTIIKIDGEVETYLDRTQIRVLQIRPAKEDEYDLRDMLPTSERDPDEMTAELAPYIEQITNPHLRQLVDHFFTDKDFLTRFRQVPAARRIHHAYLGGLLEHVLEIAKICITVLEIYPQIDADLLLAGALLHDIGKLREYTWDFDIDYSDEGRLLGHIVMGDEMITDALASMPEFPPELALRLRHTLLSHHGRYEWGSPRRPKTLEAIALHHIENLDAQINRFHLLIKNAPPDDAWTPYDRLLGRQLYAGDREDLLVEERGWIE
ncbi:MAG: 3'-5' exoribonuclease YhaM family protein [Anaerolineales bacterium]